MDSRGERQESAQFQAVARADSAWSTAAAGETLRHEAASGFESGT